MGEEVTKKNPAYRNEVKDEEDRKNINDSLGFFSKAEGFWETISDKENPSKMSLIEGLRGSGKSSFINILLKVIQEDKKDGFLPVLFTPRYLEPDKFYQSFFEQFSSVLLQSRYNSDLITNTKELLDVLGGVNDSMKSITGLLSFFFTQQKKSPSELIDKFIEIIEKTYSDQTIIIVIDEVDRLGNEELHHLTKLLDMIKQIAERCDNVYVLCAWSQQYLEQQIVAGQRDNDKAITYQEYCNRFFDEVMRISSHDDEFLSWSKETLGISINEQQLKKMIYHCEENRMAFVMRKAKRILKRVVGTIKDGERIVKSFDADSEYMNTINDILSGFDYLQYLYWFVFVRYKGNDFEKIYQKLNERDFFAELSVTQEKWELKNDKRYKLIDEYNIYTGLGLYSENLLNQWEQKFNIYYRFIKDNDLKGLIENEDKQLLYKNCIEQISQGNYQVVVDYCYKYPDLFSGRGQGLHVIAGGGLNSSKLVGFITVLLQDPNFSDSNPKAPDLVFRIAYSINELVSNRLSDGDVRDLFDIFMNFDSESSKKSLLLQIQFWIYFFYVLEDNYRDLKQYIKDNRGGFEEEFLSNLELFIGSVRTDVSFGQKVRKYFDDVISDDGAERSIVYKKLLS